MRILITGANGFIAAEIINQLSPEHEIIACLRKPSTQLKAQGVKKQIAMDFIHAQNTKIWEPLLHDIDVIINTAGVLHTARRSTMWAIHFHAPKALFDAAAKQKIKKIIHFSALGVDQVNTPYAKSKYAIEKYLCQSSLDHTIIRPSFVYGRGSYGGSSFFPCDRSASMDPSISRSFREKNATDFYC